MNGERFLASLKEVNISEKISMLIRPLKENSIFWKDDTYAQSTQISELI